MPSSDPQNCNESGSRNCTAQADEMKTWIVDQIKAVIPGQYKRPDLISIEPFQGLLKVRTLDGLFFFKALRDIHLHEQRLTQLLARICPVNSPEVVCANDEKGWLLMRDVGGVLLEDIYETKYFEEAIYNFARLQTDCIKQVSDLLASGCPDYQLERLALNIESFFEHLSTWEVHNDEIYYIREQVDLMALRERLIERCERIKADNIPSTLCHGDLNPGNIFAKPGQYVFIDWAEGYVGHPFFTPLEYFNIVKRARGIEIASIPTLRRAYLTPWSEILKLDIPYLIKLLDLSRPLGMLRTAMRTWHYYTNVETIREDPAATAAYLTRIRNMIQRMCKTLNKDEF
jgi:Phosphotransferase enzyme family